MCIFPLLPIKQTFEKQNFIAARQTLAVRLTQIHRQTHEHDHAEPDVERGYEIHNGDYDVTDGGQDLKDDVGQQVVDAGRAAVDRTQDFPCFATQVPAQRQAVQVGE